MSCAYVCASCRRRLQQQGLFSNKPRTVRNASLRPKNKPNGPWNLDRQEDKGRTHHETKLRQRDVSFQAPLSSVEDDFIKRLLSGRENQHGPYSDPLLRRRPEKIRAPSRNQPPTIEDLPAAFFQSNHGQKDTAQNKPKPTSDDELSYESALHLALHRVLPNTFIPPKSFTRDIREEAKGVAKKGAMAKQQTQKASISNVPKSPTAVFRDHNATPEEVWAAFLTLVRNDNVKRLHEEPPETTFMLIGNATRQWSTNALTDFQLTPFQVYERLERHGVECTDSSYRRTMLNILRAIIQHFSPSAATHSLRPLDSLCRELSLFWSKIAVSESGLDLLLKSQPNESYHALLALSARAWRAWTDSIEMANLESSDETNLGARFNLFFRDQSKEDPSIGGLALLTYALVREYLEKRINVETEPLRPVIVFLERICKNADLSDEAILNLGVPRVAKRDQQFVTAAIARIPHLPPLPHAFVHPDIPTASLDSFPTTLPTSTATPLSVGFEDEHFEEPAQEVQEVMVPQARDEVTTIAEAAAPVAEEIKSEEAASESNIEVDVKNDASALHKTKELEQDISIMNDNLEFGAATDTLVQHLESAHGTAPAPRTTFSMYDSVSKMAENKQTETVLPKGPVQDLNTSASNFTTTKRKEKLEAESSRRIDQAEIPTSWSVVIPTRLGEKTSPDLERLDQRSLSSTEVVMAENGPKMGATDQMVLSRRGDADFQISKGSQLPEVSHRSKPLSTSPPENLPTDTTSSDVQDPRAKESPTPQPKRLSPNALRKYIEDLEFSLGRVIEKEDSHRLDILWRDASSNNALTPPESEPNPPYLNKIYGYFILGFMRFRRPQRAIQVWNVMHDRNIPATIKMWDTMLRHFGNMRDISSVQNIWKKMLSAGVQPDDQLWATRIQSLAKSTHWRASMQAYEEMLQAWVAVAKRVLPANASSEAIAAMGSVKGTPKPTVNALNAVLPALIRARREDLVARVLKLSNAIGVKRDIYSFNSQIKYALADAGDSGLQPILEEMRQSDVTPDIATFTMILDHLFRDSTEASTPEEKLRRDQAGTAMLQSATAHGIELTTHTFSTIVSGLLRESTDPSSAYAVVRHMIEHNIPLSSAIYTSLLTFHFAETPPNLIAIDELWQRARYQPDFEPDAIFFDRLVEGYAALKMVPKVKAALAHAGSRARAPGWVALRAAVVALANAGDRDGVDALLADLVREGMQGHVFRARLGKTLFVETVRALGFDWMERRERY